MEVHIPSPEDHCGVKILVRPTSSQSPANNNNFQHILERLKRLESVEVSENPRRSIFPRFVTSFDKDTTAWGEFQAHRRVLGLVFVIYVEEGNADALEVGLAQYKETQVSLKPSLLDSRLLIFGPVDSLPSNANLTEQELIVYESMEKSVCVESGMQELIRGIYWVLEGKRVDTAHENMDAPPCPRIPHEEKEGIGLYNRHSKNLKKKSLGRIRKQVADYTLLTGLPTQAMESYLAAIELLKTSNDWLWLAGAYEGWGCAAIAAKYYKDRSRRASITRTPTFSPGQMKAFQTRSQSNDRMVSSLSMGSKSSSPHRTMESSPSNNSLFNHSVSRSAFNPTEIIDRFKSAVENYEKYSFAAPIECECVLKAATIFRHEKEYCEMEVFLRENTGKFLDGNFTQFSFTYKATLCQILASIFRQINFKRKSAFFLRLAALFRLHIGDSGPRDAQEYKLVYPLLHGTLEGIRLKEKVKDLPCGYRKGWSAVQIRSLHEVYISAARAGFHYAAVRHLCYLLQAFLEDMDVTFVTQLCTELAQITGGLGAGGTVPINTHLQLNKHLILLPVSITKFPKMLSFDVMPLPGNLAPKVVKMLSSSVFIYAPFERQEEKTTISWVVGCVSGVALRVANLLPFELQVSSLTIQSEGVEFEPTPVHLTLPAAPSEPVTIKLLGTPQSSGKLTVTGYSCELLGVKNVCRLKDIPWLNAPPKKSRRKPGGRGSNRNLNSSRNAGEGDCNPIHVEVLPPLPTLDIRASLPRAKVAENETEIDSTEICTAVVTVYSGQIFEHSLRLINSSETEKIQTLHLDIQQPNVCGGPPMIQLFPQIEEENSGLDGELKPGEERQVNFKIYGVDPMSVSDSDTEDSRFRRNGSQRSFPRTDTSSASSDMSSSHGISGGGQKIPYLGRLLVSSFVFRYQGIGGGDVAFERLAKLSLYVTIVPALTITDWRVLSGDTPRTRYLALDLTNSSDAEAELHFDNGRQITVQSKEVCRVPLLCPCCETKGQPFQNADDNRRRLVVEIEDAEKMRRNVERHVVDHLDIRWNIPSLDLNGLVPIGTLLASDAFLRQLVLPPLLVGVSVNDVQGQEEHTVGIGELVTVLVELSQSRYDRRFSGRLSLLVYQDVQNSAIGIQDRTDHVIFVGPVSERFSVDFVPPSSELDLGMPGNIYDEIPVAENGENCDEIEIGKEKKIPERSRTSLSRVFRVMFRYEGVYKVKPNFNTSSTQKDGKRNDFSGCDLFLPIVSFSVVTKVGQ